MIFIEANWPAPKNIHALTTVRTGGTSDEPYDSFNLAQHVGDNAETVENNRIILKNTCQLPNEPVWLNQTHSTVVIPAIADNRHKNADASFANQSGQVCVVLTADCLPILICNPQGTEVAAIHAGWRGLLNGVIENTLNAMSSSDKLAWLGPAISKTAFEVGDEVREAFLKQYADNEIAFTPSPRGRWMADLYALAKIRLQKQGVTPIFGGEYCTFTQKDLFYSYRREGDKTGRMASLIWFE